MYKIPTLPLPFDVETKAVLKQAAQAHRRLAELKGESRTIPNESILINTLTLQEAKDSSAVENIITTHDELYKAELFFESLTSPAAKEVQNYAEALKKGFAWVRQHKILPNKVIINVQEVLEQNQAGFRSTPGTTLKNADTGEVVYTPPQDAQEIKLLMDNLEQYINDDQFSNEDVLVKMAVIHHQFESIHPFSDGNGRTGRIINILYLVSKDLLDLPILYLSRYVIANKGQYYKLLQQVRDTGQWEKWVLFMLKGVEETAIETIRLVREIKTLMQQYKIRLRTELPKIYSQDLLNNLLRHPYTKIRFLQDELDVSRLTAAKYLDALVERGYLQLLKIGRSNFYLNEPLFDLLINAYHINEQGDSPTIESVE